MKILKDKGFRIYYNLHKGGFTVQHYIKSVGWRKLDTIDNLKAYGVSFKVYENGRQRVLNEKKKYVHAFVLCDSIEAVTLPTDRFDEQATYNPYKTSDFINRTSGEVLNELPAMYLHSVVNDKGRKVGRMFY